MTLTKNTDKLRREVAAHVASDSIAQRVGRYWDKENSRGCFIGCLAKGDDPAINEATYGLPAMLQRIAESIFEALPADDAKAFFAVLPDAVRCDGKDLTRVGWQFLASELRSLPAQPAEIQAVIDPVIVGMDLLASGQKWSADAACAAAHAAAVDAAAAAAWAAVWAAEAAVRAAEAAVRAAARTAAWTVAAAANSEAARLRQRDLLLRLISEAPVIGGAQ